MAKTASINKWYLHYYYVNRNKFKKINLISKFYIVDIQWITFFEKNIMKIPADISRIFCIFTKQNVNTNMHSKLYANNFTQKIKAKNLFF